MIGPLVQAAVPVQQPASPLIDAAAPRVYRNGAWRGGRRTATGGHHEMIETGAYGPPPVAGPSQAASIPAFGDSTFGHGIFGGS